jgi:hypothetical protein
VTPQGHDWRAARPADWPAPVYDHPLPQQLHDICAGRSELPNPSGRRHHYVPQLILRGYECAARPKHVFHLEKRSGRPRCVPIRSAAWEKRLYAVAADEEYDNRVEGLLGLIEAYAAPAIARLLEGSGTATEDESMPISMLLGLQMSRSPGALDELGSLMERAGQAELRRTLANPRAFAKLLEHSRDGPVPRAEVEAAKREYLAALDDGVTLRLANKREVGLDIMVRSLIEAGLSIAHADWWVLHGAGALIANDCGYARFDASDRFPLECGIIFPLRHNACLIVAPPTSDATQVFRAACDAHDTARINLRVYAWARTFIFGSSQESVTATHGNAKGDRRAAHPPTLEERLPGPP